MAVVPEAWKDKPEKWWAHVAGCLDCKKFWDPVKKDRRAQPVRLPSFAELEDELKRVKAREADMLEAAWGIIANAGGWDDDLSATPGWREAAERWRDRYHEWLDEHVHA